MKNLKIKIDGVKQSEGDKTLRSEMQRVSIEHAPLKELHEIFNALYKFINDTSREVDTVFVELQEGSVIVNAELPPATAVYVAQEIEKKEYKRSNSLYTFISALERVSRTSGLTADVSIDDHLTYVITPQQGAGLTLKEPLWLKTELTIHGRIQDIGGKCPNIHIITQQYGELIVDIDIASAQSLTVYKSYTFNLTAEQNWDDPAELRNVKFVSVDLLPQQITLEQFIELEESNWEDVDNALDWVANLRGGINDRN